MRIFSLLTVVIGFLLVTPVLACHIDPNAAWNISGFENPESAHYDAATNIIYVSNVSGEADKKDKKGFISTLSTDGKIKELHWVDGLNAPKGIRVFEGKLYVSDIDRVLVIDIAKKKIVRKVPIPKAKFLNDVTVDSKGTIYVTDTLDNVVYSITQKGIVKKFLVGEKTEGPNGILVEGENIYIASWGKNIKPDFSSETPGRLLKVNIKTKAIEAITPNPIGHTDGLEKDQHGDWIVSDWKDGKIIHVSPKGEVRELLALKSGTADIGFVPSGNLVIVPQMKENTVTAYRLQ